MEEKNNSGWITILVIALIWSLFFHKDKYEGYTAEEWYNQYDEAVGLNDDYQSALEEANYNIEEAKYYSWESYDEMGEALDNLETVSEP